MTTTTTLVEDTAPDAAPTARSAGPGRRLAAAALGAAGLGLAWLGGPAALAGAAAVAGAALLMRPAAMRPVTIDTDAVAAEPAATTAAPAPVRDSSALPGAAHMVTEVVPVWSRQLEATRLTADQGLSKLLASFAQMSDSLETLLSGMGAFGATAAPGAGDRAVEAATPQMQALLGASQRAFEQRDAAVAELRRVGEALAELSELATQARTVARHTRLVAFNASIEANRQGTADAGNQAVAGEMRSVADQLARIGESIGRVTASVGEQLVRTRREAEIRDTAPDELQMELERRAREALAAMLASIGASLQTSGAVRDASQALRGQLDEAFVHFQFGDRVSQMLAILANDMNNLAQWIAQNPHPPATEAAQWLARLEASYTMEEQRSEHHGNVHVDRGSEVEFF
jgi:methyl-accepting chemotaxis protein